MMRHDKKRLGFTTVPYQSARPHTGDKPVRNSEERNCAPQLNYLKCDMRIYPGLAPRGSFGCAYLQPEHCRAMFSDNFCYIFLSAVPATVTISVRVKPDVIGHDPAVP
jgi:hypothetical protein